MSTYRCIICVEGILKELGILFHSVELGEVELYDRLTAEHKVKLKDSLLKIKLELLDDQQGLTIEKIKIYLQQWMDMDRPIGVKIENRSDYVANKLNCTPDLLADFFQRNEGKVISKYCIEYKVGRAKVQLRTTNNSYDDIAEILHYKNKEYFFKQFKQETGMTPEEYRNGENNEGK